MTNIQVEILSFSRIHVKRKLLDKIFNVLV